jgi:hypothetical protein
MMGWGLVATTTAASAFGALIGTLAAPFVSWVVSERQVDAKMLEMGVAILREAPKVDDDPMRSWAVKVVEKKSGIAFSDAQRAALLKKASSGR